VLDEVKLLAYTNVIRKFITNFIIYKGRRIHSEFNEDFSSETKVIMTEIVWLYDEGKW
jgi:hypothetical protein